MFKTFKDAKRRVVESVLEAVKASDRTVDEEFDLHHAKFTSMMSDLNESGAGIHSLLVQQKTFFQDSQEVAKNFYRVHQQNVSPDFWPGTKCQLTTIPGSDLYNQKLELINNVYRSSAALMTLQGALEPLRETIAKLGPEVEATVKERNTIILDLDSYRRRLKTYLEKRESLETQGKGNEKAYKENEAEIVKFEAKESTTKDNYEHKNASGKQQIVEAKALHDHVVSDAFITTVVCQYELYSRAAKELKEVIALLPKDKVEEVKAELDDLIKKGGVQTEKEDKTKFQKGLAIFTGKAVPSDFKKEESAPSAPPSTSNGNPFGDEEDEEPAQFVGTRTGALPPPPPVAAALPPQAKKVMVKALFEHVAEADDELNFNAGDLIEVIATSDDGWWQGRFNGREGLFPVNYVDTTGI